MHSKTTALVLPIVSLLGVLVILMVLSGGVSALAAECPPGTAWFRGKCRPVYPETPTRMMEVTANGLNMRSCPSLRCAVVEVLPRGTLVEVMDNDNGFSRIAVPSTDATGWVSNRYLAPSQRSPAPGTGAGRRPLTEPRYQ